MFGAFFAPFPAKASGLLDYVFGNQASADTATDSSTQSTKNLQTMALLQADVSPASIMQDKNSKDGVKDNTTDDINANTNIDKNALKSVNVSSEQDAIDSSCGEPNIYVVADGDSISKVALMLDVPENTVLAANNMKQKLVKNDVLFIPSVPGVIHTVSKGQTMQGIAKLYKVDINDIAFCNGITPNTKLKIDTEIVIPGGKRAIESNKPVNNLNQNIPTNTKYYQNYSTESLVKLINPVPGYRLSQGLHDGNAVDLAIAKGTPIHAAASGKVIFARMGYNGGFGGLVIIIHLDGIKTMYGHMSRIIVHVDDQVVQDQIIGYVGSTGHSTGPHVHFVVEGEPNPGVNGSWAN